MGSSVLPLGEVVEVYETPHDKLLIGAKNNIIIGAPKARHRESTRNNWVIAKYTTLGGTNGKAATRLLKL